MTRISWPKWGGAADLLPIIKNYQIILSQCHGWPPETVISSERHALAVNLFEDVAVVTPAEKPTFRDRLDRVATHRVWGYGILVLVLGLFFQGVFRLGQYAEEFPLSYLDMIHKLAQGWLGADSLAYYVVGEGLFLGIFGGIAIVLPYLLPFLLGLSLLEDSGYLPRVAFLMDNLMHGLGLHGKSIIPFILGYGCSVPKRHVTYNCICDDISTDSRISFPCGLLLNELITNSLKYAFDITYSPTITLKIEKNNTSEVTLIYKDNGRGLPKDYNIDTPSTLRMILIKQLVMQLQGTFKISNEDGFVFKTTFKV